MNVRSVNRGMTTSGRTTSLPQEEGMIHLPDHQVPRCSGNLRMTFQTKISIPLQKQLVVHRTMGLMAGRAAFPHRFMLEDKGPGLLPMTLRTGLIPPRKGQTPNGLLNVMPVRIMAIHTIHAPLEHGMMAGKVKLGIHPDVTLDARLRRLPGIHNLTSKGTPPPRVHVQTARSMTRLATPIHTVRPGSRMDPGMHTVRKDLCDRLVTRRTGLRAHKFGPGDDGGRGHHRPSAGAGEQQMAPDKETGPKHHARKHQMPPKPQLERRLLQE